MNRRIRTLAALSLLTLLAACTSVGVGISLPIPGVGSVHIGGDSSGRVGGGVSVGVGGVSVGVGGSGQVRKDEPPPPGAAASAAGGDSPAPAASAPSR